MHLYANFSKLPSPITFDITRGSTSNVSQNFGLTSSIKVILDRTMPSEIIGVVPSGGIMRVQKMLIILRYIDFQSHSSAELQA